MNLLDKNAMQDTIRAKGKFIATLTNPITGLVTAQKEAPNLVTNAGKNLLAKMILDRPGYDTGLTIQSVGTGTTAASASDTQLETEEFRQSITVRNDPVGNIAAYFTYFSASDVTLDIHEVGIFGHSTASAATTNSGVLFARALLDLDNTSGDNLNISYILTIN